MDPPRNAFKRALASGATQIGLWSNLADSTSAEIIGGSGFDWILLDMEHGPNEIPALIRQMQAIAAAGPSSVVVRVPWNDAVVIKRVLDAGALTVLVPMVQDAEEARRAVAATRYPPAGIRGAAGSARGSRFGRVKDYFARADGEIAVLVQVESTTAVSNIEAIAAVDGVDGIFVGPADLAGSMGKLATIGDALVRQAISASIARIRAAGKPPGFIAFNPEEARARLAEGVRFLAVGNDGALLAKASDQLAAAYKDASRA
jgi:4-hydroxy-2-oxoheptanedioate aldolase